MYYILKQMSLAFHFTKGLFNEMVYDHKMKQRLGPESR